MNFESDNTGITESETETETESETETETEVAQPTGLRRSTTKRMIGGVASGIAERFDIDANIVRAIFVVLACLWGFGAAIYLILWVLVPRAGDKDSSSEELAESPEDKKRRSLWRTILLLVGALAVGLLFVAFYTNGPRWGSGIGTAWLILLVVLAVMSFRGPHRRFTLGRLISGFFLVLMSLIILAGGGLLAFLAMTGVPISGGVGDNVYAPTSITQVKPVYRTAFGGMTIDLRQVSLKAQTLTLTASVAVGNLTIEVPPGVVVDVTAHSGVRDVQYPQGFAAFDVPAKTGTHQSTIRLNVRVGIGEIQLFRSAPGFNFFGN